MVGYVVGLGDRHGENILFDSTNGDCVHVDFNVLFNKVRRRCIYYSALHAASLPLIPFPLLWQGQRLDVPEIVPFRLTHNMVHAMVYTSVCRVAQLYPNNLKSALVFKLFPCLVSQGVTGHHGTFRTCCELTLRLMREKKDLLLWCVAF